MPDTKSEIAAMLKTHRQKLGLSLDQIFEHTRINPEFLSALETGDFDVLPKAYVRLFLKTYAREVGLDPQEVISRYEKTVAPPPVETPTAHPPSHRKSNMAPVILSAIGLVIVAIIALNLGEQNEIAAPLDTTATGPEIRKSVAPAPQPKITTQISRPEPTAQTETQTITPTQSPAEFPTIETAEQSTTPTESDSTTTQPEITNVTPDISLSENQELSPVENAETLPTPVETAETLPTPVETAETLPTPVETAETLPTPVETAETLPSPVTNTPPQTQIPEPTILTSYALPMPVILADEEVMTLSGFARETTRLAVSADGRELFSGIIQAGSQKRWQANDRFQLQVERAGAIAFSLQDQPLESASPPDRSLRLIVSRTLIRVEELDDTPSDR